MPLLYIGVPVAKPFDFVGCNGRWAPINGGWWAVRPSCYLYEHAFRVLQSGNWSASSGWLDTGPFPYWRDTEAALTEWTNGGRGNWSLPSGAATNEPPLSDWSFFGSASDQGLLQLFFGRRVSRQTSKVQKGVPKTTTNIQDFFRQKIYFQHFENHIFQLT